MAGPLQNVGIGKQLTGSGYVTADGKKGVLIGYAIQHGTATQSSVTFRDGGASGTIVWVHSKAAQTVVGDSTEGAMFPKPMLFETDIYATLAGTGTKVCVEYAPLE